MAEWNNTMCPKSNMCIDESLEKNRIQCVESGYCTKYFYFFKIKEFTKNFSCKINENNRFSMIVNYLLGSKKNGFYQHDQNQNEKIIFYQAKVPAFFNPKNLKLPLDFINYDINFKTRMTVTELSILIVFGFLSPILIIAIFLFFYYQAIKIDGKF